MLRLKRWFFPINRSTSSKKRTLLSAPSLWLNDISTLMLSMKQWIKLVLAFTNSMFRIFISEVLFVLASFNRSKKNVPTSKLSVDSEKKVRSISLSGIYVLRVELPTSYRGFSWYLRSTLWTNSVTALNQV